MAGDLLCEYDGPRTRTYYVKILGSAATLSLFVVQAKRLPDESKIPAPDVSTIAALNPTACSPYYDPLGGSAHDEQP